MIEECGRLPECFYLIHILYGIVGGYQGVAMLLLGFLYVVAMGLCVVARVFISDWCMGMWVVARELLCGC